MEPIASYPFDFLEEVFKKFGIYLLERFEDGQMRWGDQQMAKPYKGRSAMSNPYTRISDKEAFDIFTIRNIANRLGKAEQIPAICADLEKFFSSKAWN